ncbi:MAG: hypothetical protein PVH88_13365 [Ignavibacteria bacterium]|jgi:hypothetical protein
MEVNVIKSLKEIRTPLAFLSLTVIATEGLLFSLIGKSSENDKTIITVGIVILPFFIIFIFYLMFKPRSSGYEGAELKIEEENKEAGKEYDLFVSVPMAAFDKSREYEKFRASILDAIRGIKKSCAFSNVFFAGQEISTFKDFESEDLSIVEDYTALKNSTNFVLIYPQKLPTSALIELGWAMVMKKPIILFSKNRDDLPYLMKNADSVYKNIAIYTYKTSADIQTKFSTNQRKLFDALTPKSSRRNKTRR